VLQCRTGVALSSKPVLTDHSDATARVNSHSLTTAFATQLSATLIGIGMVIFAVSAITQSLHR
jgi:hypothetical protein